ncbi:MAG: alpha/beta fold hydrolase [Patescibacteria group bacterium]
MKKIFIITFLFAATVALVYFFSDSKTQTPKTTTKAPTPTPMPFVEMTIPYLRENNYDGKLGELKTYADQGNYTSYLANYTSDNLKINGFLTIPKGDKPTGGWPAIVFVHGYIPPTQYQTTERYVAYVDTLARNGFVVFKIDLRGHGESEGSATGAYYTSDYIVDVLNARNALAKSDFVNPKKIGLWGHSMAGNVVMRSLAVKNDIPAVVIWAGAVYSYEDFAKYGLNDTSYRPPAQVTQRTNRRNRIVERFGAITKNSPFWKLVIPTNYLENFKGAIELHHAVDDNVVNIGYSRDLVKVLSDKKIKNELFEYPTGGHNVDGASFATAMQRTVDFYRKNL